MKPVATRSALVALVLALSWGTPLTSPIDGGQVFAEEEKQQKRKTRRTPALRARVYDQLARAQAAADEGKTDEALEALNGVKDRADSMNSYEKAMMYNFYGFIHYNAEQYDQAIASFEQVVAQQPIPESFEMSTLFSLAQLHMMRGNYDKTIEFLNRWESLYSGDVPAKNYLLKAQAKYQQKAYQEASDYINQAVAMVEEEGKVPEEGWFILQRAIFYELKQAEEVKNVLVKMVKHYNQDKYWVQLGGMYGELGEEKKQLAVLETAYQQGFISKGADVFNLAQLYYYHQVPYKGAYLMEKAMDEGVLDKNLRNLKFLANCWTYAKENEKAIPVLQTAAALSDNGELDGQLAQLFLNMEKWEQAILSAKQALKKGNLKKPGFTHLIMGMAYFNTRQFNDALNQLAEAEKHKNSKRMAEQWSKYVQSEKISHTRLQAELSS